MQGQAHADMRALPGGCMRPPGSEMTSSNACSACLPSHLQRDDAVLGVVAAVLCQDLGQAQQRLRAKQGATEGDM